MSHPIHSRSWPSVLGVVGGFAIGLGFTLLFVFVSLAVRDPSFAAVARWLILAGTVPFGIAWLTLGRRGVGPAVGSFGLGLALLCLLEVGVPLEITPFIMVGGYLAFCGGHLRAKSFRSLSKLVGVIVVATMVVGLANLPTLFYVTSALAHLGLATLALFATFSLPGLRHREL